VEALKPNGLFFWLTATVPIIIQRIGGDTQRPPLKGGKTFTEEIEEVLREREPKYAAAAHYVLATDCVWVLISMKCQLRPGAEAPFSIGRPRQMGAFITYRSRETQWGFSITALGQAGYFAGPALSGLEGSEFPQEIEGAGLEREDSFPFYPKGN